MSIASFTPSIMLLCSSEISFRTSGFTYSFVLRTGVVFLFFLKLRLSVSYIAEFSIFEDTLLPLGKNLALLLCCDEFYYDIFASFKLDILGACLVSSIKPYAFIFIWNSSIQPILWRGSLVSILEIIFLRTGEMVPGKAKFWVLRTSIRLAIELDWKGQWPKTISYKTTPSDQISALME